MPIQDIFLVYHPGQRSKGVTYVYATSEASARALYCTEMVYPHVLEALQIGKQRLERSSNDTHMTRQEWREILADYSTAIETLRDGTADVPHVIRVPDFLLHGMTTINRNGARVELMAAAEQYDRKYRDGLPRHVSEWKATILGSTQFATGDALAIEPASAALLLRDAALIERQRASASDKGGGIPVVPNPHKERADAYTLAALHLETLTLQEGKVSDA